jgi:hypothetical protein
MKNSVAIAKKAALADLEDRFILFLEKERALLVIKSFG